jgi:predicted TIM-barrel fold metal-dependent hydrolase
MIVDCHTHIWQSPDQLGPADLGDPSRGNRARGTRLSPTGRALRRTIPAADPDYHWHEQELASIDKSIVLGFKSRYLKSDIPNHFVADYVRRAPDRLIGFAGIDPTDPRAMDELSMARDELRLKGVTLSPANQDFHPSDTRAMKIYEACEATGLPILFHPGAHFIEQSKMEFGRPYLIDEVARSFPKLKIVIGQLGQPWIDETIVMLGKHLNVYADVSGLLTRPWQAYNTLINCYQYGVMDKLLFGSDFPYTTATDCIEALYKLNQIVQGTNMPVVPREALRGIVERDAMGLLGLH